MTAVPKAVAWQDIPLEKITEMVSRRVFLDRDTGTMHVQTHLRKGALVPQHAHGGAQSIHVTMGSIRLEMGGGAITLGPGETLEIPAGTPHQMEVLADAIIVDARRGDVAFF
jgi:quercetin dioxygenase-like cupin family protein